MVEGKLRSRTKRRVFVRTPSGKNVIQYKDRKPSAPKCGKCGAILKGISRVTNSVFKNLPKSQKRPERPFGGVLCSKCMRTKVVEKWLK